MIKTCENPECKLPEREFHAKRSKTKYCSSACSNQHNAAKIKSALSGLTTSKDDVEEETTVNVQPTVTQPKVKKESLIDDDELPVKRTAIPLPQGMGFEQQLAFTMMQREIDRFEREALMYKKKAKSRKTELDAVREELAKIKTDNKIEAIEREHAKPSGLQGFTDSFKGILENQYIGPVIAQFLGNMMGGGMMGLPQGQGVEGPDAAAQQAVMEIFNWFAVQDAVVQQNFKMLVDQLAGIQDKVKVNEVIIRLINVMKGGAGAAVTRSNATGTMGY